MCVCVCVCVCACVRIGSTSFIIPIERSLDAGFKLYIEIEQADFTDWVDLLTSNLMEKINTNPEALTAKT